MPIDPARALDAYVRAHTYLAHHPSLDREPDPEPTAEEGAADPAAVEGRPLPPPDEAPAAQRRHGVLARFLAMRHAAAVAESVRQA
ncbi:hypothetical protein ACQUSR_02775 [Streptomyces sp. P1-3]|uniref:hypothetical protein n=1 Tax=Streptomyces sp. P1-3 TaxID=3421658 RepID=UPI003D36EDB6